jgi:RNA polymerase sigma-70 factor, ECF subfamily
MAEESRHVQDPAAATPAADLAGLQAAHRQFLALIEEIRPELHRYCARMTGSVIEGEDVVQETLAAAYYELSQLRHVPALRPWLLRIAHNRAIDFKRRQWRRRDTLPLEVADQVADDAAPPTDVVERAEAVGMAIERFVRLPPAQRSCVILKDVLGYSLEEVATLLGTTVLAVKAALHRGRERLRREVDAPPAPPAAPHSATVLRYARLFNAQDWDAIRALLVEDVQLDLVSHRKEVGSARVGGYVANYANQVGWRARPVWLGAREVIAIRQGDKDGAAVHVVEFEVADGLVTAIRDFYHVPYLLQELDIWEQTPPTPWLRIAAVSMAIS